jgi:hypothetical protein
MKTLSSMRLAIAAGVGLSICSCSAQKPPPPVVEVASERTPGGGVVEQTVTATARVTAIDQATRMVTLLGSDGKSVTMHVGPEVKNLAQVKQGDTVTIVYYESLAYEVKKAGTAKVGVKEAADAMAAPLGAKPAGGAATMTTITAKVTAIDRKANSVSLKGPKGKVVTVKVKDPTRLDGVKVGDLVEISYTEAVAVAVDKAS